MNFAQRLIEGITSFMYWMGTLFSSLFHFLRNFLDALTDFFAKPLALLWQFLDGIFYFITQLFVVVVLVIKIFVASFQFLGSLCLGIFRTITSWLNPSFSGVSRFPTSASNEGFATVMDIIAPTGLLTVVPIVATAFLWFYFVLKIIGLFGGDIMIAPHGRGGSEK